MLVLRLEWLRAHTPARFSPCTQQRPVWLALSFSKTAKKHTGTTSADPAELAQRLPPAAKRDLLEWSGGADLTAYLGQVLAGETLAANNLNPNPLVRITDDRPYNEYFLLRQWGLW